MIFVGRLMLACLLLAVIQKTIAALLVMVALLFLYGMLFHPVHTIRGIAVLLMVSNPGWTLIGFGTVLLTTCVLKMVPEKQR